MMKVRLIASTTLDLDSIDDLIGWGEGDIDFPRSADLIAEFAGRACYQSFNRPNASTASNSSYIANILRQQHFSVLEHATATFYVTGVSRSLTHELIRHRHLSYSQLSQRFVGPSKTGWVKPPAISDKLWESVQSIVAQSIANTYADLYDNLTYQGVAHKQAREAARAILPNATETRIVVSGNMRAWREFLVKRWHVAADAEIRAFAGEVLDHLRFIATNIFSDIPEKPYGGENGNNGSQGLRSDRKKENHNAVDPTESATSTGSGVRAQQEG